MSEMHWPEITKDTPLTEVKRIHQAIWDYTIEYGEKPNTPYHGNCVGCEYVNLHGRNALGVDEICEICPICWPKTLGGSRSCIGENRSGLFDIFLDAIKCDLDYRPIAKQIRDLPFKYELEEKENV